MDLYKYKYLKYKSKYLDLQGGTNCNKTAHTNEYEDLFDIVLDVKKNEKIRRDSLMEIIEIFNKNLHLEFSGILSKTTTTKKMIDLSLLETHTLFFNKNTKKMDTTGDVDNNSFLKLKSIQDKLYAYFGEDRYHIMKLKKEEIKNDYLNDIQAATFNSDEFLVKWTKYIAIGEITPEKSLSFSNDYLDKMTIENCIILIGDKIKVNMSDLKEFCTTDYNKKLLLFIILYILYLLDKHVLMILNKYNKVDENLIELIKNNGTEYPYKDTNLKIRILLDVFRNELNNDKNNDIYFIGLCDLEKKSIEFIKDYINIIQGKYKINIIFFNTIDNNIIQLKKKNFIGLLIMYKSNVNIEYDNDSNDKSDDESDDKSINKSVNNSINKSVIHRYPFIHVKEGLNSDGEITESSKDKKGNTVYKLMDKINNLGHFNIKINNNPFKIAVLYAGSSRDKKDKTILFNKKYDDIDIIMGDMNTTKQDAAYNIFNYASKLNDTYYSEAKFKEKYYKLHTCKKFRIPVLQQQFSKIEPDPNILLNSTEFLGTKDYIIVKNGGNDIETFAFKNRSSSFTDPIFILEQKEQKLDTDTYKDINKELTSLPNINHYSDHFIVGRQLNNKSKAFSFNMAADNTSLIEYYIDDLSNLYKTFYKVWINEKNTLDQITSLD